MDLLTRLQKWRNGECGNCKTALLQLVADMEDTLTSVEQLVGTTRAYREAAMANVGEQEILSRRNAVVQHALIVERKINGTD